MKKIIIGISTLLVALVLVACTSEFKFTLDYKAELKVGESTTVVAKDENKETLADATIVITVVEGNDLVTISGAKVTAVKAGNAKLTVSVENGKQKGTQEITIKTTQEITKPVISGADGVEIAMHTEFDPLDGVTAMDATDGDLTSKITVEGTVDVTRSGKYTLVYTVENSLKQVTKKDRVVVVLGFAGFVNGDFVDGLQGWDYWVNESQDVAAEFKVENETAIIDIIEQSLVKDNNWWDVQLKQVKLNLTQFTSYTLKFTAHAEAPRRMAVQVQGGGLTTKPINEEVVALTTEAQEFTFNFAPKQSAEGVELQFAFGSFAKVPGVPEDQHAVLGKIFISDVQVIPGPELENQAPELKASNVYLFVGEPFIIKQGLTVTDDRDVLTLEDVTVEDITEGTKFVDTNTKGVYTFKFSVTDSEGLSSTVERSVFVAEGYEIPSFTDVNEEGVPVNWTVWFENTRGGLNVTATEGVVAIEVTKADEGQIWENQFKATNIAVAKGTYKVTFQAKADIARPMRLAIEGNAGIGLNNINVDYDLTTDWVTYTLELDEVLTNAKEFNRSLQFWFGDFSKVEGYTLEDNVLTTVYIKDLEVTKVS